MFIKRGDGKILSVIETEEMTEEQKKSARDLAKKTTKNGIDNEASQKKPEDNS